MNIAELQRKLIAAARANPPSDRVPFAFEKRIMAYLASGPVLDRWGLWAGALWRAAVPCVAIMLVFSAWSLLAPRPAPAANDLSQAMENTVLIAVDQEPATDSLW